LALDTIAVDTTIRAFSREHWCQRFSGVEKIEIPKSFLSFAQFFSPRQCLIVQKHIKAKTNLHTHSTSGLPKPIFAYTHTPTAVTRVEPTYITMISKYFSTDDGTKLHYLEAGQRTQAQQEGQPPVETLIILPGWLQTARMFASQVTALSTSHHVIVLDLRGQGASARPQSGSYRAIRLAKDLLNLMDHLQVQKTHLLAVSLSSAIVWSFIELFGQERLQSLVLIESAAVYIKQSHWSKEDLRNYGGQQTMEEFRDMLTRMESSTDGEAYVRDCLQDRLSTKMNSEDFEALLQEVLQCRPVDGIGNKLALGLVAEDYRDLLPTVRVPTMCIGANHSPIPPESPSWTAAQMVDAKCDFLPGSSFFFYETPGALNVVVDEFLVTHREKQVRSSDSKDDDSRPTLKTASPKTRHHVRVSFGEGTSPPVPCKKVFVADTEVHIATPEEQKHLRQISLSEVNLVPDDWF
jgi:pimeloyl-ACP methyl ester carboxylesterase